MNLTYNEAYESLTAILNQLEDDSIQLDTLAEKVKEARALIAHCEKKLRAIESDVDLKT
jgi:exodeoxyribonuclease VII small subunit